MTIRTKKVEKVPEFTHRELCMDLAVAKGTNFIEIPLGSIWLRQLSMEKVDVGMADVLNINCSYNDFCVDIFECKVSTSDYQSDIRSGKWKRYLEHCNRFYFAAPKGVIDKRTLPEEAGLIIRTYRSWHVVRAPRIRNSHEIPYQTLLSLIFFKGRVHNPGRSNFYYNHIGHNEDSIKFMRRLGKSAAKKLNLYHKFEKEITILNNKNATN